MRRTALAVVLVLVAAVAAILLTRDSSTPTAKPTPSTSPTSPSSSPTASPTAQPKRLVLNGDDLGVTAVGATYAAAVAAVSTVLGAPLHDPATTASCFRADREVEWGTFRLAFVDGRLAGWSSHDPTLRTPSGVGIGSTVTTLRRVYGARLTLYPANTDNGEEFSVSGVDLQGGLTGLKDTDSVTSLYNGEVCAGP